MKRTRFQKLDKNVLLKISLNVSFIGYWRQIKAGLPLLFNYLKNIKA
jgi:hypothetical protein